MAWESVAPSVPAEDRGWVHEAVFGTLRLRGRLDHLIDLHVHRGLASLPRPLLRLLRLGAYQLLYMGSVPAYAAVSQAAAQARALGGPKGAGLVNGVLRALARAGADESRFPSFDQDPVGYLSTWGSHPRWLVERWVARFGAGEARKIVDAGNRRPALFLRPVGVTLDEAASRLHAMGVQAIAGPGRAPMLRLEEGADPSRVLEAVPGIVQDAAAAEVVEFVSPPAGGRVADLCAAPGGKGIAMAASGAWVVGLDPSLGRLKRMEASLRRLDMPDRLVVARGESPPLRPVDAVLVDAPCTGTGTLARNPDARWRLKPDSPAGMAEVQKRIMDGAASVVRQGGLLAYATCTLEVEENEEVVDSFLDRHGDFALDERGSTLRVLPGSLSTDGAFAVRLRRCA